MKKFYYILFLLLPLLAMVGCTDESLYDEDPESATATLSYQISIDDDMDSRAIGDGAKVNELKVGIFQDGVHIDTQTITEKVNAKFPVELTLLKDLEYTIVFWAQAKDNGIYTLNEETFQVFINYDKYKDISLVGTEAFEAFYATDVVKLGNNKTLTKGVDLTRPFAQLNIAAKEEDVFNKVKSASLTIENVYTRINLLTGRPEGEAAKKTLSFKYSDEDASQKQKIEIGEDDYYYVASAYLLAPEKVKLTGSLYDGNDDVVKSFDFSEVTLKPNHRTNIYGEMIQVEVLTPWDGIIPNESTLTTDAQNRYIIDEEADLAWLSVPANMATLSENPTFIVTKDVLNMGSIEISSIQLPVGSTFEGSNKTIKNFANSLFGDVTNITVQNLVLDNVVASTNSHVGVLVNTLKGTSTFSNITISNSSATTTEGAAGGMVGYIVRKTETDRSETLAVTFNNCDLVGVTANGSLSEGKFVGLLSGYDNGETLTFDADCSADASVTDFTSPYKTENQSVWITEELADTYDGWLGSETYRRGNVTFDDVRLVPKWDGTTTVEPLEDENGVIMIYSAFDFAGVTKTFDSSVTICMEESIDMNEKEMTSFTLNEGSTFKGQEGGTNVIYNLRLTAPLFGDASVLTVENVGLNNINVSTSSDAGILVGTLKGGGTFTNISIASSGVETTADNAGGMVGYIVRNSPTLRSEQWTVTFSQCKLDDVTVDGTVNEGMFVGLLSGYDNGEELTFTACSANMSADDFESPYKDGDKIAWHNGPTNSPYNAWLGNETFYRGKVLFNDYQFVRKWDGVTNKDQIDIEPLLANATYDSGTTAGTNRYVVYSPYDLAGVRKKTASPAAIYLRADIDMNGQGVDGKFNVPSNFTQSACSSTDDNVFDPFSYVTTLDGKKSGTENYSIHNLSIAQIEQERAAFILYASGTTSHKNINFRNCQTVAVHKPVSTDAKAYGAILVSNVDATYTMENVHAYDCKVFALQKVGTLGARISGTSTLKNNSVNNCYVENYECKISERFSSGEKTIGSWTVTVYADFYPYGEVGGMYGFIQGNSTLTGCKVNGTTIYALGQDDKMATTSGSLLARLGIAALGYYKVPGRHVSTLIGNIRATGTVTLTDCSVDTNTKCTKRHDKHNSTYNYIGQAYIVKFVDSEGSVTVDGKKLTLADCNKNTRL